MIRSRQALLDHIGSGGKIRREWRHEPEPKVIWTDAATGETVHGGAAAWALAQGKLRGVSDGLFPGEDQTFEGVTC